MNGDRTRVTLGTMAGCKCPESLLDMEAGYIADGVFYPKGSVAQHFFEEYREHLSCLPKTQESDIQTKIAAALRQDGWQVELERNTPLGRIDIWAERKDQAKIIEVKLTNNLHGLQQALGQLLFYGQCCPDASLWLATPDPLDDTIVAVLRSYNVFVWEV